MTAYSLDPKLFPIQQNVFTLNTYLTKSKAFNQIIDHFILSQHLQFHLIQHRRLRTPLLNPIDLQIGTKFIMFFSSICKFPFKSSIFYFSLNGNILVFVLSDFQYIDCCLNLNMPLSIFAICFHMNIFQIQITEFFYDNTS